MKEDSLIDLDSNDGRNYYNTSHISQEQVVPDRPYHNKDYIYTPLNSSFNSSVDQIDATYMNQKDLQTLSPKITCIAKVLVVREFGLLNSFSQELLQMISR